MPEEKITLPFHKAENGEEAGTATLEGEMKFSRIIQAGEDKYLMVDEVNWDVARKNCPGCGRFRLLDAPKEITDSPSMIGKEVKKTLKVAFMKSRQVGVTARLRGYPVIELGRGMFAVPERHTEELCQKFPQSPSK